MGKLNQYELACVRAYLAVRCILQSDLPPITKQHIAVSRGRGLQDKVARGLWIAAIRHPGQALVIRQAFSAFVQLNAVGRQHIQQAQHRRLVVAVDHGVQDVFIGHGGSVGEIRSVRIVQGDAFLAHLKPVGGFNDHVRVRQSRSTNQQKSLSIEGKTGQVNRQIRLGVGAVVNDQRVAGKVLARSAEQLNKLLGICAWT